ncbi:ATP-binding protein [Streptomyces sp. UNOB3_S3]|nr:ATP-binding protein [Streptomyces sp. UNOB3_S3]
MIMTAHPAGTGVPAYTQTMPREAASAHRARLLVTAALNTWDLPDLIDTGVLIVSELVANAVVHTECRNLRVTVSRPRPDRVRVAVVDMSRQRPVRKTPPFDKERGRGLVVVAGLADRWKVDSLPWGKRVWAELRTDARN